MSLLARLAVVTFPPTCWLSLPFPCDGMAWWQDRSETKRHNLLISFFFVSD